MVSLDVKHYVYLLFGMVGGGGGRGRGEWPEQK